MAILQDLTVYGATRLISDTFAAQLYGDGFHHNVHDNDDSVLLAGGGYKALTDFAMATAVSNTYVKKVGDTMTGTLTFNVGAAGYSDSYSSKGINMGNANITGVNSIYTADASDNAQEGFHFYRDTTHVDTIYAKAGVLYFVPNRELTTNGTSYTVLHTGNYTTTMDARYVKLDAEATEQTIKSSISTMSEGVINLWRNSGDQYAFLGFSNGTTKTYLGGIGFKSQGDHNLYKKDGTNYYKIADANNITDLTSSALGTSNTNIATIAGVTITAKVDHVKTSITANTTGIAGASNTTGDTITLPVIKVNADGHVSGYTTRTHTVDDVDKVDGYHAGNASGNVPVSNGTLNTDLNADLLDDEHAYQLRAFPKNNSSVLFSSLPLLENNISLFKSTPVVSMENAPEGLCFGPISTLKSYTSDFIAVQPGEILYGEIWAYRASEATGTAGYIYYGVQRFDRNKNYISSNSGLSYFAANAVTVPSDGVWHKYSNTVTIPTTHTVYNGSDGKGVYYIKVYVLVNYSDGTIPTYIGRILLKRLNSSGQNGYIATTAVQPTSTAAQNITGTGNITSNATNTYDLGSSSLLWRWTHTNKINLNRAGAATFGRIYYYNSTYYTWVDYMSNSAASAAPTGGKPSTTTEVTNWAKRSLIENSAGFGWIWESCANTSGTNPIARMSLSSATGRLRIEANASSTTTNTGALIVSSVANGSSSDTSIELWRGTNASWSISNESGNFHIRDNYTSSAQTTFLNDHFKITYNSGTVTAKNILPFATNTYTLGSSSYRWKGLYIGTTDKYGDVNQPIYWENGIPKSTTYSLSSTVSAGTANHMAWYSANNTISPASNIWATNNSLFIGTDNVISDTDYKFAVAGGSSVMETIVPKTANTYNLGASDRKWDILYVNKIRTAIYEISEYNNRLSIGNPNLGITRGVSMGNLMISDLWGDSGLVPQNGIYSKGQIKSGVADGTAPFEVTSKTQVQNLYAEYAQKIKPLASKDYFDDTFYATVGSNYDSGSRIFLKVKPTGIHDYWRVLYKIRIWVPSNPSYVTTSIVEYFGYGITMYSYRIWNTIKSGYSTYYNSVLWLKKDGLNAGYGHLIGTNITYATYYTTSTWYRYFHVDVLEVEGCTYELLDTAVKYSTLSEYNNTNYNGISNYNATSQGLQETGDANDTTSLNLYYTRLKAGANGIMQNSLIMQDGNNTWQSFTTTSGTGTSKTKNTTGFKLGSRIYYASTSGVSAGNYTGHGVIYPYIAIFSLQYSLNINTDTNNILENNLSPRLPVYIVGHLGNDGLFYLEDVWWTQTEPTTENGLIYIRVVGSIYADRESKTCYRGDLISDGYAFWFKDGKFRRYNTYGTSSDGRYVKLDPGATEQTIKSSINSLSEGVIDLWRSSGDYYTFLGFSNGTTKTYLGGIGYKAQNDHNLYKKDGGNYYKIADANNITDSSPTLGTSATTIATIAGVNITAKVDHLRSAITANSTGIAGATNTTGATITLPVIQVNDNGHVSGWGTRTHTVDDVDKVDGYHISDNYNLPYKELLEVTCNTSDMTTDYWYVKITIDKTWQSIVKGKMYLDASYSNDSTQAELQVFGYNLGWAYKATKYNREIICGISSVKEGSQQIIWLKLIKPREYSGSTPNGLLKIYHNNVSTAVAQVTAPDGITFTNTLESDGQHIFSGHLMGKFHHKDHNNDDAVLLAGGGYQEISTLLQSGYWANQPVQNASSTTTTPQFARIGLGAAVNASYSVNAAGTILSTASPGFANDVNGASWSYTRYKSGTDTEWHVGTTSADAGRIAQAGSFEIRDAKHSYDGIAVRRGTSEFGRLVIVSGSGESSISVWTKISNQRKPQWTFGLADTTNNRFFWYYTANNADSGKWVANLSPTGQLYLGDGNVGASYKLHVIGDIFTSTQVHIVGSGNVLGSNGNNTDIYLGTNGKYVNLTSNENAFRRGTGTASADLTLGTSTYKWKALYVGTADSYGSSTQPIYWDNGVPKAISCTLSSTVSAGTANHMAWYSANNTISPASNIWATNNSLFIGTDNVISDTNYKFAVVGGSIMQLIIPQLHNTYDIGLDTRRWKFLYSGEGYFGTASGAQCHLKYDTTDDSFNFIFD